MKEHKLSKRFAMMFLNAAGDAGQKALEELAVVNAIMQGSEDFSNLLVNPMFTIAEKENALKAVGERAKLSAATVRFMVFLCEQNAAWSLAGILVRAVAMYSEKVGRVTAKVLTSFDLSPAYEERLKAAIKKMVKKDVVIEYGRDESLLGGMLVQVGSTMFDGSLKGQLRLLKDELIKG